MRTFYIYLSVAGWLWTVGVGIFLYLRLRGQGVTPPDVENRHE